jgi:3-phenylpropionate/trans-cinnamate dioxygenase ferredoxin component
MWWRKRWRAVAAVGSLQPGQIIPVSVDGVDMALGRDGDEYFAVQRRCVHRGTDLTGGFIARHEIVCPQHGWRFSLASGRGGPGGTACVDRYPVRVVGDQIEVDPKPMKRR